jgi:hypothetical protein
VTKGTVAGIGARVMRASPVKAIATDALRNAYARLRCEEDGHGPWRPRGRQRIDENDDRPEENLESGQEDTERRQTGALRKEVAASHACQRHAHGKNQTGEKEAVEDSARRRILSGEPADRQPEEQPGRRHSDPPLADRGNAPAFRVERQ